MCKIAFGIIVFNGNYVLREVLESVYPYASQILIAEGPVTYWQQQGYDSSCDGTNLLLHFFNDPENKIKIVHGQYPEKTDQANAYIKYMRDDIDYIWNLDCDEVYKPEHIELVMNLLDIHKYTTVGFKSRTFYGGFDHCLTGFERSYEFLRIHKVYKGSTLDNYRLQTIKHVNNICDRLQEKKLSADELWNKFGVEMYHYSYVFPTQVYEKIRYYKSAVSQDVYIDDYFKNIYLPWVLGTSEDRVLIENKYDGVHDFKPHVRGSCRTESFNGKHPDIIADRLESLKINFLKQLDKYKQV